MTSSALGVCVFRGGLGSIFPTITPKCLTQLTVCVRLEVLVLEEIHCGAIM